MSKIQTMLKLKLKTWTLIFGIIWSINAICKMYASIKYCFGGTAKGFYICHPEIDPDAHFVGVVALLVGLECIEYMSLVILCICSIYGWFRQDTKWIRFSGIWVFVIPLMELITYLQQLCMLPETLQTFFNVLWIICTLVLAILHSWVYNSYMLELIKTENIWEEDRIQEKSQLDGD